MAEPIGGFWSIPLLVGIYLGGGDVSPSPGLQKGVPITIISRVYGVESKLTVTLKGEMTKFPLSFACDCKMFGFSI